MNPKRPTPRHIIIKMAKFTDKKRILKAAREKQLVTYKGASISLSADYSVETLQARRQWQEICQVIKSKCWQPRWLYPARLSFKIECEIRSFTDQKQTNKQKSKSIHLHQISIARDAKGTALRRWRSEREENTGTKGKYGNEWVPINNNLKFKWIKCSKQKI